MIWTHYEVAPVALLILALAYVLAVRLTLRLIGRRISRALQSRRRPTDGRENAGTDRQEGSR